MRHTLLIYTVMAVIFASGFVARAQAGEQTKEQNFKVVQTFAEELINGHDVSAIDRIFTSDYREHTPNGPNQTADAFRNFATAVFSAFPDVKVSYTPLASEGDMITVYGTVTATHSGEFFGIPASGREVTWTELHVFRIQDKRIAEHWVEANLFGLIQQISGGS